jgi:hypothetical protein
MDIESSCPERDTFDPKKPLPGSLVIVVLEVRDPFEKCKRIGNVVLFQTKIPLKDALCGYPISLTLPDKSNVVFAQNIIHPAQWYKLSNTNFYISFEIVYPNEIDANTQDQFRKLFGLKTDKSIVTHELEKIENLQNGPGDCGTTIGTKTAITPAECARSRVSTAIIYYCFSSQQ